jgi:hypothetical protein
MAARRNAMKVLRLWAGSAVSLSGAAILLSRLF